MSKFSEELKNRHAEQEQRRVGDIYTECVKLGCNIQFLKSFDGRLWTTPVNQTKAFLENEKENAENLKQWHIFLSVTLGKRPSHEKAPEWKESLLLIK